ncbi:MAG: carbamoyl-phosphate synthase large subunit [Sphingobacteriia bacterium]|nr:carbamoyl-phosphate synthase large subunit [Sphingobacteriia bacterium]NCC39589.1 carbamoyl-phosphate synthase large subunit [Gammaproteobacteria bacterium]
MPKDTSIHKVLIIGSGPIVIGQACEFDYSGTQACKALRRLGYEIVLVNSNPATIMTDPGMADATYIEPLDAPTLERIIAQERPDALLPNLGGQTALNLASELAKQGILEKYGVRIIGVQADAIERGEDRQIFKDTMTALGVGMPRSEIAYSLEEAERLVQEIGIPCVVRPAYTMGGTGGGLVYNLEEFRTVAIRGLAASPTRQILIEESVEGWEELELEVVRDAKGQKVTVCYIENIDAMGVHTGDSFCSAPMLDVPLEVQERLQRHAYDIVDAIGVIGGTNVQFAYNRQDGRITVIEINPRTSRSSALASKATGFPIAYVSALLAGGLTLDEIPYWRDGTLERYTPSGDYVVIKFARWAFEKFKGAEDRLGTQMRAVGEVMSIGKTYKEALQKAIRSLEIGRHGLGFAADYHDKSLEELTALLAYPTSERQFILYEALRKGASIDELHRRTHIKPFFLRQMQELVELEEQLLAHRGGDLPEDLLRRAKQDGFADRYLAQILDLPESTIRARRARLGLVQAWEAVPVSGVEDAAYYYSTYNAPNQVSSSGRDKVLVLGGGPNRIGQGIEFDYCCVHAAFTLRELGYETIMVNCNPETVSTDYDTSDKLYFEPLTLEDVLAIYEKEQPIGAIVQFGGQTPLNLSKELEAAGVRILGTSPEAIDLAEDRDRFREIMTRLAIPQPDAGMASHLEEAIAIAERIGYPLMVRPSYVLGGRGMEIVHDEEMLRHYVARAVDISPDRPILIDRFLSHALEVEADAISDGVDAFVPAIMEHIEEAGVHSGDSACVLPPVSISPAHQAVIEDYTRRIAIALGVKGLINVQYAIADDTVYILEANPRASRTVPLVSKVCGLNMVRHATEIMMDRSLVSLGLERRDIPHFGVKEAVFPFSMYHEVDPVLGPEMRSTGEVLGLADSFPLAFHKSQEAAKQYLPQSGTVLLSVTAADRAEALEIARDFLRLGFKIKATEGTHRYLTEHGVDSEPVLKLHEGRPNIADLIADGELQLVINTPFGRRGTIDDSYIRKAAVKSKRPYVTTMAAARAAVRAIAAAQPLVSVVRSLQSYHADIR